MDNHEALIRELEAEKLKCEVGELRRPWWQRHIVALVTALVTIAGSAYAVASGFFDLEHKTLELQKAVLQKDIADFTLVRDSLSSSNHLMRQVNDSLGRVTLAMQREVISQKKVAYQKSLEVAKLQASLQPAADRAAYYERAVKDAQKRYSETQSKYFNESAKEFTSSYDMSIELSKMKARADRLCADTASQGHILRGVLDNPVMSKGKLADLREWYGELLEIYKPHYWFGMSQRDYNLKSDSGYRAADSILHRRKLEHAIMTR